MKAQKRHRNPILIVLACVFILEAFLWETFEVIVDWLMRKMWLNQLVSLLEKRLPTMSPYASLIVLGIPAVLLFPIKFAALYLFATGHLAVGLTLLAVAKLFGVGLFAWLFGLCRDQLLKLRPLKLVYRTIVDLRKRALEIVAPYSQMIYALKERLSRNSYSTRLVAKMRAKIIMGTKHSKAQV